MSNLKIDEILRYTLAGGIALLAVWFGYKEPNVWLTEKREGALITVAFAALPVLIGALVYVLHRALPYPFLYRVLAKRCGRPESIREMDILRWKHQGKTGALQNRMSEWAAQIHFLYAASWSIAFANLVAHFGGWTQSSWHWIQLSVFPILLVAAILHHWRYLHWEAAVFAHDASLPN